MKRIIAIVLVSLLLLGSLGTAAAQEGESCDEDCVTCRNNNFYYVIIVGLVIFTVFFYLRNRDKIE